MSWALSGFGIPIRDTEGMNRVQNIIRRLLNSSKKSLPNDGDLEVTITDNEEDNAASSPPSRGFNDIIVNTGALNVSDDQLALTISHELGHIIKRTADQKVADKFGTDIAVKAGFDRNEMEIQARKIRDWPDDTEEDRRYDQERYKLIMKILRS